MPLLDGEASESHEEDGMGGGVVGLVILSYESLVVSGIPMVSSGNSQAGMKVDTSGLGGWSFWVLEFSVAREGFTRMVQDPTLGLFKLRLSELSLLAHLKPRDIHTDANKSSSQSSQSVSSWPVLAHGCCQRWGKAALFVGLRVSMLAINVLISYDRSLGT